MTTPTRADDWDQHWKEYANSAEFNPAQAYRRRLILSELKRLRLDPMRVMDIGSGQGDFAGACLAAFPSSKLLGLELSAAGVQIAERKVPSAEFQQRDLSEPTHPPTGYRGWANAAVCSEVLEHCDAPDVILRNASEYMAPGCALLVTVPGGPMSAFDRHIGHRTHFTTQSLGDLLQRSGFQPGWVAGAGFPFFNLYRSAVILQGDKLIAKAAAAQASALSFTDRLAMRVFDGLFRFNRNRGALGWQIAACARFTGKTDCR